MAHCYLGINQGTQLRQLFALYLQGVNYIKMVFHYKTMQPYSNAYQGKICEKMGHENASQAAVGRGSHFHVPSFHKFFPDTHR